MSDQAPPPAFCPHCGYNLKADEPLILGPWELYPNGLVLLDKVPIKMTPQQGELVYTVARAGGKIVTREAAGLRLGVPGDIQGHINTLVCRIKKHKEVPIETVWRSGLRWAGPL